MTAWNLPSRWRELEPLLDAALERPPAERAAFASQATGDDSELFNELSALLHDAERITKLPLLDQSASGVFSSLLREDAELTMRALERSLAGRYTIVRRIGAGGMASVFLANDVRLCRQVALKVLHPDLSHTIGAERFAREVRTVAALEHPNIVGVFDSGEADGHLWFAMPFIEGESLRQRLLRVGPLPLNEALSIVREAADALGFAHARGVMHRDIKPDNILLADGHAFVADFGVARAVQESGDALTVSGMSVGTPAYMAPEQAAGERSLDERVDVYALGAVLYEMLAGTTAFTGPSAQAIIIRAMTTDPQPIHPIRTAVTPALDAVILKAMSRTPADRYQAMEAFSSAVAVAAESTGVTTPVLAATRAAAHRTARIAFALVGLALLVMLAWVGLRSLVPSPPKLAVLPFQNRSRDSSDAYLADGFSEELGNRMARVRQLAVVSNTAVRRIRGVDAMSTRDIGRLLGATYLTSGSVQRVAGRLRVSIELTRAASGERVWSDRYDRAETELPRLMGEIAMATAVGMLGRLPPDARVRLAAPTEDSEAYAQYLRGSLNLNSEGAVGIQHAISSFEAALVLDSRFAAAQGRLAWMYARALIWNVALPGMPVDSVLDRASMAASRALALDSASADAWAGRGVVLFFGKRPDYSGAVAALGRASALDSNNVAVHWMRGQILRRLGEFAASELATRAALAVDPQFENAYNQMAILAFSGRRFRQALAFCDTAIALRADQWQFWEIRARVKMALIDTAGARADAEEAVRISPPAQHDYAIMVLAQSEALAGDTALAREALKPVLSTIPPDGPLLPRFYQAALAQLAIGERDEGLKTLERIKPRGAWLWSYLIMPGFDPVRSDPRFVKLIGDARPPGAANPK